MHVETAVPGRCMGSKAGRALNSRKGSESWGTKGWIHMKTSIGAGGRYEMGLQGGKAELKGRAGLGLSCIRAMAGMWFPISPLPTGLLAAVPSQELDLVPLPQVDAGAALR